MCSPKKLESEIVNPLFLDNLCMCTDCYGSNCNLFKESMEMYLVRLSRLLNIEITRWFWEKFPFLQLCNKFQSKFFIMKLSSPTKNAGFMVGYQTCRSLVFNHSKQQVSSPRWLIHMGVMTSGKIRQVNATGPRDVVFVGEVCQRSSSMVGKCNASSL